MTFTVDPPPPALAVAPATLSFTATAGRGEPGRAERRRVTNTGGGTLSFTVADDAPWLSVTPASGNAPATLSVAPSIAGLAAGHVHGDRQRERGGRGRLAEDRRASRSRSTAPPATPPGLVAAYGFEETTGTGATDGSGNGHAGTIIGATRSTDRPLRPRAELRRRQRLGDGARRERARPDDRLTMSAWVNPTAVGSIWRTVLMKEQPGGLIYALYAGDGTGKPSGHVFTTASSARRGPANTPLNTWTHLASTWDGDDAAAVRQRRPGRPAARSPGPCARRPACCGSAATRSGPSGSAA